ncbi:hypothetical protein [Paenibacillus thiaminolyticus]|uniref:hypothetical protein n=1 Tax=Paenibacillus thiaminolyticus TaxID=49283 RepID=UPI0016002B70|nr:hypothetical protein [Paenibacillus thiaminolyticus]
MKADGLKVIFLCPALGEQAVNRSAAHFPINFIILILSDSVVFRCFPINLFVITNFIPAQRGESNDSIPSN